MVWSMVEKRVAWAVRLAWLIMALEMLWWVLYSEQMVASDVCVCVCEREMQMSEGAREF